MTLNKLIANDIINYGMDKTSSNNYIVYLDSYIDDYDEYSQKYILENLKDIENDIRNNANVCDLQYDKKEKSFDMIFYWDGLLDRVDKYVLNILKENEMSDVVELDEIWDISSSIMEDQSTKNLTIEKIKNACIRGLEI